MQIFQRCTSMLNGYGYWTYHLPVLPQGMVRTTPPRNTRIDVDKPLPWPSRDSTVHRSFKLLELKNKTKPLIYLQQLKNTSLLNLPWISVFWPSEIKQLNWICASPLLPIANKIGGWREASTSCSRFSTCYKSQGRRQQEGSVAFIPLFQSIPRTAPFIIGTLSRW